MKRTRKEKRSIILFYDLLELVYTLDEQQAGKLFKAIVNYEFDEVYDSSVFETDESAYIIYKMAISQLDYGKRNFVEKFGGNDEREN